MLSIVIGSDPLVSTPMEERITVSDIPMYNVVVKGEDNSIRALRPGGADGKISTAFMCTYEDYNVEYDWPAHWAAPHAITIGGVPAQMVVMGFTSMSLDTAEEFLDKQGPSFKPSMFPFPVTHMGIVSCLIPEGTAYYEGWCGPYPMRLSRKIIIVEETIMEKVPVNI